jgi:hypothetical protein
MTEEHSKEQSQERADELFSQAKEKEYDAADIADEDFAYSKSCEYAAIDRGGHLLDQAHEKEFDAHDSEIQYLRADDEFWDASDRVDNLMERIYQAEIKITIDNREKHDDNWRRQDSWERAGAHDDERDLY